MKLEPNLFIVGFQKCGSSSLFHILSEINDISVSNPKETFAFTDFDSPHFNADNNISNPKFDWNNYYGNKNSKYFLEASVCNFYQDTAINYISKLREKKVIFIIRNPIDRFVSTFDYYGKRIQNYGPILDLEEYFNIIKDNPNSIKVEGAKYAIDHGKYSYFIRRWKDKIGSENILVIGLKSLVMEPEPTILSICNFLKLPHPQFIEIQHRNKTKNIRSRRLDYYTKELFRGSGLGKSFLGKLYKKLNSSSSGPELSKEMASKLAEIYREEFELYKDYF